MQTDNRAVSFTLPNGVLISAKLFGGSAGDHGGEWKSIDVRAVYPGGDSINLCAVDWEDGRGVKVIAFAPGTEDPVYMRYCSELISERIV
jgi:hypothetical protein